MPTITRSRSSLFARPALSRWRAYPPDSSPPQILAADLQGNGYTSLVVRNAGDGTISIFPGDGHGWFAPRIDLPVGLGVSDIQVADLEQDGRLDILYTDRLSGEVGVLENLGGGAFSSPIVFPAGAGPYGSTGPLSLRRSRVLSRRQASPLESSRPVVLLQSSP